MKLNPKSRVLFLFVGSIVFFGIILYVVTTLYNDKQNTSTAETPSNEIIDFIKNGDIGKVQELVEKDNSSLNAINEEGLSPLTTAIIYKEPEIALYLLDKGAGIEEKFQGVPYLHLVISNVLNGQLSETAANESIYIELLSKLVSIDKNLLKEKNEQEQNALQVAVINDNVEIAQWLIEKGVSLEEKDILGNTSFHIIATSNLVSFKNLIEEHYDGNILNLEEDTPLIEASKVGHDEIVSMLVKYDNINHQNKLGKTALMYASEYGYANTVKVLLANGADPTIVSEQDMTALDYANEWDHKEVIEQLR